MTSQTNVHRKTVTIQNRMGLHARPAVVFVDIANRFQSSLAVRKGGQVVDGKSIMQVMMLAATQGTELVLEASGPDAPRVLSELEALVNRKFDEE